MRKKSAKQTTPATDVAHDQPTIGLKDLAELAQRLGFASPIGLLENSISVSTDDGKCWYVTPDAQDHWLAWNEEDLELFEACDSEEAARVKVREQSAASSRSTAEPEEHRDVVDEASWESFPASDPPAW